MGTTPPKVVVAALGPVMLKLAGRLADGTATWMTGPPRSPTTSCPTIRPAADEAGRPAPMVIAGVPVCVTDDPAAARAGPRTCSRSTARSLLPGHARP